MVHFDNEPLCPNCNDEGCNYCAPLPAEAACDVECGPSFEDVFGDDYDDDDT